MAGMPPTTGVATGEGQPGMVPPGPAAGNNKKPASGARWLRGMRAGGGGGREPARARHLAGPAPPRERDEPAPSTRTLGSVLNWGILREGKS